MIKIKQIENLHETIQKAEENAKQYANQNFERTIVKNSAFNKDFGTIEGTVAEGNHQHSFSYLTDKPNTLEGYGINNTYTSEVIDSKISQLNDDLSTQVASHVGKMVTVSESGHMSSSDKVKLDGIQSGAEVNQNTFAKVQVNGITLTADQKQDVLNIEAGTNVTLSVDELSDKVIISSKDTVYVHPGTGTNPHGTTKSDVGLGNVTNESKETMFTNATLTGIPTAPTASTGEATDQIATTLFVSRKLEQYTTKVHTHDSSEITSLTGYVKGTSAVAIAPTDNLNSALGKLEKGLEGKSDTHTHPYRSDSWVPTWNDILNKPSVETTTGAQEKATSALTSAKEYTDTKVASLVKSAPETLDTLKELADALGNDPNFATTVANKIGTKADLVYVNGELTKKANTSHTHTWANLVDAPTSLPANGGNSDTAARLKTARTINGVSFDGSNNITVYDNTKLAISNTASGTGTFNSIKGCTITIGKTMSSTNYRVSVTPTSNPDGSLGEIWVESKTATSFVVKCSGSTTTTTFDWMVIM